MKTLNINCPVGGTGYGITSLNIIKELTNLGVDISLFPIGNNVSINSEQERETINNCLERSNTFNYNSPCLKIWHQFDLANKIGNGHYYSFPFFETNKFNDREIHQLNYCDYIFSASHWGKEVLEQNGVTKPIIVTPLGVDRNIFKPTSSIKIEQNKYIFIHIGKYEKRKGHDVLLKSFDLAFEEKDDVELWLFPFGGRVEQKQQEELATILNSTRLKDKIKVYNPVPTQYQLADAIDIADCGVFLSRAEGWNNEIPEVMALNKPIITTNYSAHTEYCTSENSFLVDIDEVEPAYDGVWFFGKGDWAKIGEKQIEQTAEYMRYVYKNNIKTNPKGLETAERLSWSKTASIIHKTLTQKKSYNATSTKKPRRKQTKLSK